MALSVAERQRRRREKLKSDPLRHQQYLERDRCRWHARKVPASALTDRQKRKKRREWKRAKQDYRQRKKNVEEAMANTPPHSPSFSTSSSRKEGIERRRKANRQKIQRKIEKLEAQLEAERKKVDRYKKRSYRAENKLRKSTPDSPRTKVNALFKKAYSPAVRRELLLCEVTFQELRNKYKSNRKERKRNACTQLFVGTLIKKYRLQSAFQQEFGFSAKMWKAAELRAGSAVQKRSGKSSKYGELVKKFYVENSRSTSGKKDTVTKYKIRKQRHILTETLQKLYGKFCVIHPIIRISYPLFCRLRPFWVCFPKASDRETCLCRIHDNLELMTGKLKSMGAISTADVDSLVSSISCDIHSKQCMYGECTNCKGTQIGLVDGIDKEQDTSWQCWKTVQEERTIRGDVKKVTLTKKVTVCGSVADLWEKCTELLHNFKRHTYNIRNQARCYNQIKSELQENEVLIHVDFSENFTSKLGKEIQSMHFGASKHQITLHTGVYYVGGDDDRSPRTFCTISDCCDHGPVGIWTHLQPILDEIQTRNAKIAKMHFFSDGPTSQYRQKTNIWLFTKILAD